VNHPLRKIRAMADEALHNMSERFDGMYAGTGRPSIAPEKLLRAPTSDLPVNRFGRMGIANLTRNRRFSAAC